MRFLSTQYIKRYRMELNFSRWLGVPLRLAPDYRLVPWHPSLSQDHALVKNLAFRGEIDGQIFPCLSDLAGCQRLMREIEVKDGFVPEATWLVEYVGLGPRKAEYCGTIQAVRSHRGRACIQNIGVVPFHRNRGVGSALIVASLLGLQQVGVLSVNLEVTAENDGAVRLYRRLGFRTVRTLYKPVELAYSSTTG